MPENEPESPDSPLESQAHTHSGSVPMAMVLGQPYSDAPKDLYIPPDALEVSISPSPPSLRSTCNISV